MQNTLNLELEKAFETLKQTQYALMACAEAGGFIPYEWRKYPRTEGRWQLWHQEKVLAEVRLKVRGLSIEVLSKWLGSPPSVSQPKDENSQDS